MEHSKHTFRRSSTTFDNISSTGLPHPNRVEHFYPNETNQAARFESLLREYVALSGTNLTWRRVSEDGHITFESRKLAQIINSFYRTYTWRDDQPPLATLDCSIFAGASGTDKERFIRGAYIRFGYHDGESIINMANADTKLHTIANILKDLGCRDIVIYMTEDLVPTSVEVAFTPNDHLKQFLGISRIPTEQELISRKDWKVYKRVQ